jgi:hypothetical protein
MTSSITFGETNANPELVAMLQAMRPELPDDPEPHQVEAWVELAALVQDQTFGPVFAAWPDTRQLNAGWVRPCGRNDPRTERYLNLLHLINGLPTHPSLSPIFDWFISALRSHPSSS